MWKLESKILGDNERALFWIARQSLDGGGDKIGFGRRRDGLFCGTVCRGDLLAMQLSEGQLVSVRLADNLRRRYTGIGRIGNDGGSVVGFWLMFDDNRRRLSRLVSNVA